MRLIRRSIMIITILLIMVGCLNKEYKFKVSNDVIIIDQSENDFSISMLDEYVTLTYGEKEEDLTNVEVEGNVDLSKIGSYNITLRATHKSSLATTDLTISVIDRTAPTLYVFEKELLVYIDEEIEISSSHFFINLTDGINGQISERIEVDKNYDLNAVGTYPVTLIGKDASGNETLENITIRVTDIIDEKAIYLYKKARLAAQGDAFVFLNNDVSAEIMNLNDTLAIFTPNYSRHFLWISGLTGTYNPQQSGVKLKIDDNKYYADFSEYEPLKGYKKTKLNLKYEDDNLRIYTAESTYDIDGEEVVKLAKFTIKKIDGAWLIDEFYLQYD